MRKLIGLVIFFCLISSVIARVGDSLDELKSRFDNPPLAEVNSKTPNVSVFLFRTEYQYVIATIYKNISIYETYLLDGDPIMPSDDIESVKSQVSDGFDWVLVPEDEVSSGNIGWIRTDGKVIVVYGKFEINDKKAKHAISIFIPSLLLEMLKKPEPNKYLSI